MAGTFVKLNSNSNYGSNLQTVDDCENDLRTNYTNAGHPVAYGGVDTIFNFYKGILDKEKIKEVLSSIENYTLHREYHAGQRNPSYSHFKRYQFQMDLVDIQQLAKYNDGASYLLTCIDTFTRKAFVRILTTKHASVVLEGFKSILREAGEKPKILVMDRGTEFTNKQFTEFCENNDIEIKTPYSSIHAAFIERFNRTLQSLIYKYMTENETNRFLNVRDKSGNHVPVLSKLLETYNNRKHRMTGYTPEEAESNEDTHLPIRIRMSKYYDKVKSKPVKFKVGDEVRVAKQKGKFSRGYNETSNQEIFRVYKVSTKLKIPMYTLETYDGKDILNGAFYDFEITKVTGDVFRIDKVLKTRKTRDGKTQHYVKWKGFNDTYNSWIDSDNIVKKF